MWKVKFFFSSRRRHTRSYGDWSSDVCSSDLASYFVTSPGPGTCREMGHIEPFTWSRLESLYGTYKNYAAKVEQTVNRLVQERWLTEGDARRAKAELLGSAPAARSNND